MRIGDYLSTLCVSVYKTVKDVSIETIQKTKEVYDDIMNASVVRHAVLATGFVLGSGILKSPKLNEWGVCYLMGTTSVTLGATLFFWQPMDIESRCNWFSASLITFTGFVIKSMMFKREVYNHVHG